jgi:hypothetical protein
VSPIATNSNTFPRTNALAFPTTVLQNQQCLPAQHSVTQKSLAFSPLLYRPVIESPEAARFTCRPSQPVQTYCYCISYLRCEALETPGCLLERGFVPQKEMGRWNHPQDVSLCCCGHRLHPIFAVHKLVWDDSCIVTLQRSTSGFLDFIVPPSPGSPHPPAVRLGAGDRRVAPTPMKPRSPAPSSPLSPSFGLGGRRRTTPASGAPPLAPHRQVRHTAPRLATGALVYHACNGVIAVVYHTEDIGSGQAGIRPTAGSPARG